MQMALHIRGVVHAQQNYLQSQGTGAELNRLGCDLNNLNFAMEVGMALEGIGIFSRPGPKIPF